MASEASSRFKPFKFSSKPPPLPPKDAIYQLRTQSSSRASLVVPDSPTPSSPSVQYAIRRANSPFAADSMNNNNSSASDLLSPQSAPKKALGFLKFNKRSPKSPPPPNTPIMVIGNGNTDDPDPPPPQEDDGISLPWNFQHNIHVDEGYVGLPPSWSTSLAAAGFTDDEIVAIQNRRAAGVRSPPDLRYLYNERPQSPAGPAFPHPSASTSTSSSVPILTHPTPRTTSLPRIIPLASSSSAPSPPSASDLPPPLPTTVFSPPQPPRGALPSSTSTPSLSAAKVAPPKRVPPPKRKPPTPYEDLPNTTATASAPGHKPNQASSSTLGNSSDSHASSSSHSHSANQTANTTFANMSTSAAYAYNPHPHPYANPAYVSLSYSNPALNAKVFDIAKAKAQQNGDEKDEEDDEDKDKEEGGEDDTQQGRNGLVKGGTGNGNGKTHTAGTSMSLAGGGSRFRVVNGGRDREMNGEGAQGSSEVVGGSGSGLAGTSSSSSTSPPQPTTITPDEKPSPPEKKPSMSIWGTKISSSKSKDSTSASASASASVSLSGHSDTAHAASSSSSHLPSSSSSSHLPAAASGSGSSSAYNNNTQTSTWKTTPTSSLSHAAASASSSFAHASSVVARQSSSLVEAVKGIGFGRRKGKGAVDGGGGKNGKSKSKSKSRERGMGRGRSKSRERDDEQEGNGNEVDSDEEFVSLPAVSPDAVGAGFGGGPSGSTGGSGTVTGGGEGEGRTPVWQIYSRPRAGTDASAGAGGTYRNANASQHSLASSRHGVSASVSGNINSNGATVSRKPSVARSLKSAASQGSLRSRLGRFGNGASSNANANNNGNNGDASTASLSNLHNNRSVGSLHSHHSTRNGSVTSLESIPEGEGGVTGVNGGGRYVPPMPEDAREVARGGSVRRGPGQAYVWTSPNANANAGGSSSASSSSHANANTSYSGTGDTSTSSSSSSPFTSSTAPSTSANATSTSKRTAALPPRLSLHQSKDSTDLSSWSEALLSGISLGGEGGGLGLSFGLGSEWERGLSGSGGGGAIGSGGSVGLGGRGEREREGQRERQRETDSPTTVTTATATVTARPWERQIQPPPSTMQRQESSQSQQASQPQPPQQPQPQPQPAAAARKLPTSKPPPSRPIPPILPVQRARSNSRSGAGLPLPLPPAPAIIGGVSGPCASGSCSSLPQIPTGAAAAATSIRSPNGLLSPPPSAWASAALAASTSTNTTINSNGEAVTTTVLSPAASSTGPDSAQLWNEIEQMMDPGMMSAIPGLHLSVALPAGAQNVLKSAGVGGSSAAGPGFGPSLKGRERDESGKEGEGEGRVRTVGDVVGSSPVYADAGEGGAKYVQEEDEDADDESVYDEDEDEDADADGRERELDHQEKVYDGMDVDEEEEELYGGYLEDETPDIQLRLAEDNDAATNAADGRVMDTETDTRLLDAPPLHMHMHNHNHNHADRDTNRDSSRSSSSTLTVTTLAAATIVRNVSVARRAGAYVVDNERSRRHNEARGGQQQQQQHPASPLGSHFGLGGSGSGNGSGGGSEESTGSSSTSSSNSRDRSSQELQPTPTTDGGIGSPLLYYLDGVHTPSPTPDKISFALGHSHGPPASALAKAAAWQHQDDEDDEDEREFAGYPDEETMEAEALAAAVSPGPLTAGMVSRPTIVISDEPLSSHGGFVTAGITPETSTPLSPFQRYRGWLSDVVAPLEEFIDEAVDPREHYLDLREIAEGESGSVFAALLNPTTAHKLRLPPLIKAQDADEVMNARAVMVAIKSVAIVPSGSPKLVDLQHELSLMRGLWHENVLGMDGVYVDLVEDSLWVRMELMERSLADIIALVGDGLQLQERTIARFASDVLCALEFLQKHNISHRDVRSDNLLLNKHGVLKLADFSNAVQVTPGSSMRSDVVGVVFWQAPEVRRPPYDTLKIDAWSLGATVWEMAQQDPPFADTQQFAERWPPLRQPELYSPAFHDFLRKCSEPAAVRPTPSELLKSSFIVHKACGRHVVVLLLSQCMAIEKLIQEGNSS